MSLLPSYIIKFTLTNKIAVADHESDTTEFSLGFMNSDPNDNFLDHEGNMENYSSSPSFEVVHEEVKVNHGFFVSTQQVAETFFHQLVPSQTVKVLLNPEFSNNNNNLLVEKPNNEQETISSDNGKFKTFAKKDNFEKISKATVTPWLKVASAIICYTIGIILMSDTWLVEHKENIGRMEQKICTTCITGNMKKKRHELVKWYNRKEKVSLINIRGGNSIINLFMKKIGVFLTISLALCTMWANHNTITTS